jgi:uncharacterized OB-fold protein
MPLARPLPEINEMNQHFWCGGADGHLHIMRCGNCGRYHHPYVAACSECLSRDVKPAAVSGRGTVLSVTINHQPWFPNVPVPYALALVELEEQADIRLLSNILNASWEDVKPGMTVKVCFEQHGEIFVPLFEPA